LKRRYCLLSDAIQHSRMSDLEVVADAEGVVSGRANTPVIAM
jgi:hypothetical protein